MAARDLRPSSAAGDPEDPDLIFLQVASMDLGGISRDYKRQNERQEKKYENRLANKIRVLFKDRDIVGLTGLDEKWYATVRDNHPRGLNFEPAAVHGVRL